jgi:hypothetical protein
MIRADLSAIYQCVLRAWLQKLDDPFADVKLLDPIEKMKEAACMDHCNLAA